MDVFQLVNPGMQINSPGDLVSLPLEVIGPDDLTLTFSAEGLPPGLGIDAFTGVIGGTVDATAADGSPYEVTVEATTGTLGDSVTFDWFIDNGGIAILGPADQLNEVGDDVLLQVLVDGAAEDTLTYSASAHAQRTTPPSQPSWEFVTVTHPHHPLTGQKLALIRIRQGRDPDLIVRLPDGTHAALAAALTDYGRTDDDPRTDNPPEDTVHFPLLDLQRLRDMAQLVATFQQ